MLKSMPEVDQDYYQALFARKCKMHPEKQPDLETQISTVSALNVKPKMVSRARKIVSNLHHSSTSNDEIRLGERYTTPILESRVSVDTNQVTKKARKSVHSFGVTAYGKTAKTLLLSTVTVHTHVVNKSKPPMPGSQDIITSSPYYGKKCKTLLTSTATVKTMTINNNSKTGVLTSKDTTTCRLRKRVRESVRSSRLPPDADGKKSKTLLLSAATVDTLLVNHFNTRVLTSTDTATCRLRRSVRKSVGSSRLPSDMI